MELLVSEALPEDQDRVQRWRDETLPKAEEVNVTFADVFKCCDKVLQCLIHLLDSTTERHELISLQRCHDILRLWASEHGAYDATLEATLERDSDIRQAVLGFLTPLCKILIRGISAQMLPQANGKVETLYKSAIRVYQQAQWLANDDQSSSDSDAGPSIPYGVLEPVRTSVLIRKVRLYVECLVDIGDSIRCLAVDDSNSEEPIVLGLEQRSAEDYYAELLRAKFPLADHALLQVFGRTSWERYQRMQEEREQNVQQQMMISSDAKSHGIYSGFRDSGLGASLPVATSSYAATMISMLSSVAGGKHIRIPQLSAEAKAGQSFECIACNRFIVVTNERNWRNHLYNDLRPYTCIFTGCSFSRKPFESRQLWSTHLQLGHDFGFSWDSTQCLFCLEETGSGKREVLSHFARHLEDIAAAAIPQDIDSDTDSEVDSDSISQPASSFDNSPDQSLENQSSVQDPDASASGFGEIIEQPRTSLKQDNGNITQPRKGSEHVHASDHDESSVLNTSILGPESDAKPEADCLQPHIFTLDDDVHEHEAQPVVRQSIGEPDYEEIDSKASIKSAKLGSEPFAAAATAVYSLMSRSPNQSQVETSQTLSSIVHSDGLVQSADGVAESRPRMQPPPAEEQAYAMEHPIESPPFSPFSAFSPPSSPQLYPLFKPPLPLFNPTGVQEKQPTGFDGHPDSTSAAWNQLAHNFGPDVCLPRFGSPPNQRSPKHETNTKVEEEVEANEEFRLTPKTSMLLEPEMLRDSHWFCCRCMDGPADFEIVGACAHCDHKRCNLCRVAERRKFF